MINIFNKFLLNNNFNKSFIIIILLYINSFSGNIGPIYGYYQYYKSIPPLINLLKESLIGTLSIIFFFIFTHFILKLFKGEGKMIDTLLVGSLSSIFVTFYGFLFLIVDILLKNINIPTGGIILGLIIIFFFLSIYYFQKGLKIIHNISNTKITFVVIISALIYYFGINPIIFNF